MTCAATVLSEFRQRVNRDVKVTHPTAVDKKRLKLPMNARVRFRQFGPLGADVGEVMSRRTDGMSCIVGLNCRFAANCLEGDANTSLADTYTFDDGSRLHVIPIKDPDLVMVSEMFGVRCDVCGNELWDSALWDISPDCPHCHEASPGHAS